MPFENGEKVIKICKNLNKTPPPITSQCLTRIYRYDKIGYNWEQNKKFENSANFSKYFQIYQIGPNIYIYLLGVVILHQSPKLQVCAMLVDAI